MLYLCRVGSTVTIHNNHRVLYMSSKPSNANSYNRLTVAVSKIEKENETSPYYAYGIDVDKNQPVRIRLMSAEELAVNSLQIHNNVYQIRGSSIDNPEFMSKKGSTIKIIPQEEGLRMLDQRKDQMLDTYRQKNTRESLHGKMARIGEVALMNFDDALAVKGEQIGPYKSYTARWSNFLSTRPEASFIRGIGTITQSKDENGNKSRELQLIEAIYPIQVPARSNQPAQQQAANLDQLVTALSNSNNRQGERMPFVVANIISTAEKTNSQIDLIESSQKGPKAKNLTDVPALDRISILPAMEVRERNSALDDRYDELSGKVVQNKTVYMAASDPRTTLSQYFALDDFYTKKYREALASEQPPSTETLKNLERKVFAADKTRAVLNALLGNEPQFALTKEANPQQFNAVSKIYENLRKGETRLDLLVGQKLQIGPRYQDALESHQAIKNHPINGFEKIISSEKKISVFAEMNIAIQPYPDSQNVFVSGVEPVASSRSQVVAFELSELQPANTNHVFKVRSLKDENEFDFKSLPEPKELFQQLSASNKVMEQELNKQNGASKEKVSERENSLAF